MEHSQIIHEKVLKVRTLHIFLFCGGMIYTDIWLAKQYIWYIASIYCLCCIYHICWYMSVVGAECWITRFQFLGGAKYFSSPSCVDDLGDTLILLCNEHWGHSSWSMKLMTGLSCVGVHFSFLGLQNVQWHEKVPTISL